ncbi:Hsp20/alpha crystallin family protein [bacterium]|nr:Hsp20/alpha crystallin family protein [bacterium]
MEENTDNKETEMNEEVRYTKNLTKICVVSVLAAFLGGFLATYFVIDQIADRKFHHPYRHLHKMEKRIFDDADRMYKKEKKDFDRFFNEKNFRMPDTMKNDFIFTDYSDNAVKIETNYDNDKFDVIIGLKPFNNDESKIKYNISGRKLTVSGESQINDEGYREEIAFSQDFILPKNAQKDAVQKIKENQQLIISVPLKK